MKSCDSCRFACLEDFGYSNYTVEGTTFSCLQHVHPDGEFDHFYGDEKRLGYAEQCEVFQEGEPVHIDVDREGLYRGSNKPLSTAEGYSYGDVEIKLLLEKKYGLD